MQYSGLTFWTPNINIFRDPRLVDAIIALLGARPELAIGGKTLRDVLIAERALGPAPDALFAVLALTLSGPARQTAQRLARGEDPDGDLERLDVFGALYKFRAARLGAEAFVEALDPLAPRLYSISSSPLTRPGELTLTVDTVRYRINGRQRLGVASTWFAERLEPGETLACYIQKAHDFALPADPETPILMIGPGTGIAPFRAFLEHRAATGARGRNWLVFGHQREAEDFFYREDLERMQKGGLLPRLSLAWSRDAGPKTYVQDRLREAGAEVADWLDAGAHVYVCGDAKRMARDVETAFQDILVTHRGLDPDAARARVQSLKAGGRYQADVY